MIHAPHHGTPGNRLGVLLFLCAFALSAPAPPTHAAAFPPEATTNGLALAVDLFADAEWTDCRTECMRALAANPDEGVAALLKAVCDLRLGYPGTNELSTVLARSEAIDPALVNMARYELARFLWQHGPPDVAFGHMTDVFTTTRDRDLLARAGCTLSLMLREHGRLLKPDAALRPQLEACYRLWTRSVREECRLPDGRQPHAPVHARPAQWMINFYRAQIGPAIGDRCSLHPSCSRYALEALHRHGLLGLAIYADRCVREPDVIRARESPVAFDGVRRYADPLSNHDWWLQPVNAGRPAHAERPHTAEATP